MDRGELVLVALAAGEPDVSFGPIQVQKLLFLIDREIAMMVGGPHFDFRPYDYGPFDRAVYDVLDRLHADGYVVVDYSGRYRRYSLTESGLDRGRRTLKALPPGASEFIRQAAEWVLRLGFSQLVSAIYQHYQDMKVNSIFAG